VAAGAIGEEGVEGVVVEDLADAEAPGGNAAFPGKTRQVVARQSGFGCCIASENVYLAVNDQLCAHSPGVVVAKFDDRPDKVVEASAGTIEEARTVSMITVRVEVAVRPALSVTT
jgi:hypothetical protein